MLIYDYDCAACGRRVEVVHGVYAPGPAHCPNCGSGPLRKAIAAPAVHFKGSGWAKRDRRTKVAAGTVKPTGEAVTAADGESREGGETSGGSKADGHPERGADGKGERAAAASKTTGSGTAAQTD